MLIYCAGVVQRIRQETSNLLIRVRLPTPVFRSDFMNLSKFKPLQEYLDHLPDVKWWQFKTRFIIWWSNMIDNYYIWKYNRKY